ncbi:MAG: ABC transporter ATP-binding protein [Treponema sp.]|jgi:peptide/nickel transport system ATP-binding protein|nr:ABC transporter ATP-binding protein [Treponema sp.]
MNVLEVNNLSISFFRYDFGLKRKELQVITGLNIAIREGEILAVAGSSGSGKSLLAHAVLGILPKNAVIAGGMKWFGQALTPALQRKLRGRELALVPQSVEFLDPVMRVGRQVSRNSSAVRAVFARYGLDESTALRYPFQLSGGMARRALVSTAVIGGAKLIIADEPTPGLSEELAESAMGHFRELAESGGAILLITHDLDLAVRYADRIAIFYAGTTVETAGAGDFAEARLLRHPYSKALCRAMPQKEFRAVPGFQPYPGDLPAGCLYAPRCEWKTPECEAAPPAPRWIRNGEVRCNHAS